MIMKSVLWSMFAVILGGCAQDGSLIKNVNHPARKDFEIGEYRIAVVPQSNHWSAWYVSKKFIESVPPITLLKKAEIEAIEIYSGCKVSSAEIIEGGLQPAYLQATVDCTKG